MLRYIPSALILAGSLQAISAQTPPFLGELLIKPALTTDKCLAAESNKDGAVVSLQTCTGEASQKWTFADGSIKVFGNKCLDVPAGQNGGSFPDGTLLQLWTCHGGSNQQFFYDKWTNVIHSQNEQGKCVDLTAGNTNIGARPSIYTCYWNPNQFWNVGYMTSQLPEKSQVGQYGTNQCGTTSSQGSNCQTAWINSAQDFCLWAPPRPNSTIGDTEHEEVAWCTKNGRGTRTIPKDTFKGVHFVKTPKFVQITGQGDFTKINVRAGDAGGELDNRGSTGTGNPAGGLLFGNTFGNNVQYHEWTSFLSDTEFCIRACIGPDAQKYCNHIYDLMGCYWNMPASYSEGVYETCDADTGEPMGVYGTSTFHQGNSPTPPPHPVPASSNCVAAATVTPDPIQRRSHQRRLDAHYDLQPRATEAPAIQKNAPW